MTAGLVDPLIQIVMWPVVLLKPRFVLRTCANSWMVGVVDHKEINNLSLHSEVIHGHWMVLVGHKQAQMCL